MGLFDFFKVTFESEHKGIVQSYSRIYKTFQNQAQPVVVHAMALSETLKSWCRYKKIPYDDDLINIEVLPFVLMNQSMALDLFPKYLLFRTGIKTENLSQSNTIELILSGTIDKLIKDEVQKNDAQYEWSSRKQLNLYWYRYLTSETRNILGW